MSSITGPSSLIWNDGAWESRMICVLVVFHTWASKQLKKEPLPPMPRTNQVRSTVPSGGGEATGGLPPA